MEPVTRRGREGKPGGAKKEQEAPEDADDMSPKENEKDRKTKPPTGKKPPRRTEKRK